MSKKKILLINTQFVELHISGFTNRFIGLWCYLNKQKADKDEDVKIHWLTNRTLWNKFFKDKKRPANVTIIKANLRMFKFTSRLFYPLYVLYVYYRNNCTSVHMATSIINPIYLLRLFNFLKIPYCLTYASNSIEMGAYQSEAMRNRWKKVFELARNVDVLNPTNTIEVKGTKFVSPTSFPYMLEFSEIPIEKVLNENRRNVIIFCGSFISQKNPLLSIDGFDEFLKKYNSAFPDAELWMFGKGNLMSEVSEKKEKINNQYGREAVKIIDDSLLIDCLSVSKIFLSLQDFDNYPSQSVMEAMLFCNSIISIDNGDTKKLVRPELNNVLINEKSPVQISEGIFKLLSGWETSQANRQLILSDFSAQKFVQYFYSIHSSIV